jgi:hydrogenase maturation protease
LKRTLIAAVGNVWMGDDGLGCEVIRRLCGRPAAPWLGSSVDVRDFGLRAFDLRLALERCDRAIVVDVVRRGAPPGTVHVLDPFVSGPGPEALPAHGLSATEVIEWAVSRARQGAGPRALRIVGCEPESFGDDDEGRLGLSPPVEAAIPRIVEAIDAIVGDPGWGGEIERIEGSCTSSA